MPPPKPCSQWGKTHIYLSELKFYVHSITTWPPLRAFLSKVCIVKAMVLPVVTYRHESWTIKEVECQRTDACTLWCWRRLLRVFWTARRSNQSILKEINPEYSLEGLMLMLKLQHFGHLRRRAHWKRPWCWEILKAKGKGDGRGWDGWIASLTQWTWMWANTRRQQKTEQPGTLKSMERQECQAWQGVGHDFMTEWQEELTKETLLAM